eukprot:CAMPEP_0194508580 /NCGR_PEP_ID=MMETSP0253-20130528/38930_1 /TAXON_ID=2966 /ORGANISM="Noctiluca scintillans" /LENGTH=39 /DNA_ID= /DNA_START= /DNA_END= /DNA_ORIENTATION=
MREFSVCALERWSTPSCSETPSHEVQRDSSRMGLLSDTL